MTAPKMSARTDGIGIRLDENAILGPALGLIEDGMQPFVNQMIYTGAITTCAPLLDIQMRFYSYGGWWRPERMTTFIAAEEWIDASAKADVSLHEFGIRCDRIRCFAVRGPIAHPGVGIDLFPPGVLGSTYQATLGGSTEGFRRRWGVSLWSLVGTVVAIELDAHFMRSKLRVTSSMARLPFVHGYTDVWLSEEIDHGRAFAALAAHLRRGNPGGVSHRGVRVLSDVVTTMEVWLFGRTTSGRIHPSWGLRRAVVHSDPWSSCLGCRAGEQKAVLLEHGAGHRSRGPSSAVLSGDAPRPHCSTFRPCGGRRLPASVEPARSGLCRRSSGRSGNGRRGCSRTCPSSRRLNARRPLTGTCNIDKEVRHVCSHA